jgi:hypothetical protein
MVTFPTVKFEGPAGDIPVVDIGFVEGVFLNPKDDFWDQDSRSGLISYESGSKKTCIIINPFGSSKFYFKHLSYTNNRIEKTLLSVGNKLDLEVVVMANCEWKASRGLFLNSEIAARVAIEFIRTGDPSPIIEWITPSQLPESGNW